MWEMTSTWFEPIVRGLVVYVVIFAIFRAIGKKQLGEMSPLDFVLLLIVSEALGNSLTGDDHSIPAGLITGATLIGLSSVMDFLAFKSKKIETFLEGEPQIVVRDGKINYKILEKEKITISELEDSLREHQIAQISDVRFAVLETNGKITAIKKDD